MWVALIWILCFEQMSTIGLIKDITLSVLLDLELTMWTRAMLSVFIDNILVANCSDHYDTHIGRKYLCTIEVPRTRNDLDPIYLSLGSCGWILGLTAP